MTHSGARTCRGRQRDDGRVGANARVAKRSTLETMQAFPPRRAAGNVDPSQRTLPSERGQLVRRFRPAIIIVLGLIVEPGLDRLRS